MDKSIGNEIVILFIAEEQIKKLSDYYKHNIEPQLYKKPDYDTVTYEQVLRHRATKPLQNVDEIDYKDLEVHDIEVRTKRVKLEKVKQLLSNERELIERIRKRAKRNIFKKWVENREYNNRQQKFEYYFPNTKNTICFNIKCDTANNKLTIKNMSMFYMDENNIKISNNESLGDFSDYIGEVL